MITDALKQAQIDQDVDQRVQVGNGFAGADVNIEGEYHTPAQEHAFLQPEAGLGYIDEEGRVTVNAA